MHVVVESGEGITEIRVHDADRGPIRRLLLHGATRLARDLEMGLWYPNVHHGEGRVGMVLDVGLNSCNLIRATAHMTRRAPQGGITGAVGNVVLDTGRLRIFNRPHTMVCPLGRADHYNWNYRRRKETHP